jgi:hypothetical protein
MDARTKFVSAVFAAAAFVVTPSPLTVGQANSIAQRNHVDQAVIGADDDIAARMALDVIDEMAVAEVEALIAVTR